jgi:hypothetical protein
MIESTMLIVIRQASELAKVQNGVPNTHNIRFKKGFVAAMTNPFYMLPMDALKPVISNYERALYKCQIHGMSGA